MIRELEAIETEFEQVIYRSRTEARWAVFLKHLGLHFSYEEKRIELSSGETYLPDFYIHEFDAYLEVKPSNDNIVIEECSKARSLAKDHIVWLAMGPPSATESNIIPLDLYDIETPIEEILNKPEYRYQLLEDRRDHQVYWLHSEHPETARINHSYPVGGLGKSTDHDRLPLLHRSVLEAYEMANSIRFQTDQ